MLIEPRFRNLVCIYQPVTGVSIQLLAQLTVEGPCVNNIDVRGLLDVTLTPAYVIEMICHKYMRK